jgi:hypothetical protein
MPSWPSGPPHQIARVTALEARHPAITDPDNGIRIGIGMTTGADAIYLTHRTDLVEKQQLLPMVLAGDIKTGEVTWSGTHHVNPWCGPDLIDLNARPKTAAYFTSNEDRLRARHVGRRQPLNWYRTIDRPIDGLAEAAKLLIADLRPRVTPVLETGGLYPHHNLFWITSTKWDLRVLGGLLLSDFGTLFVETYSPRMASGTLRVTAQYLRRIRVPAWESISQNESPRD